jgi:hypothetical protein
MPATAERQQLTEALSDAVPRTDFSNAEQLDRIERLISTREEVHSHPHSEGAGARFPGNHILDRLERLLSVLQRVDEENA